MSCLTPTIYIRVHMKCVYVHIVVSFCWLTRVSAVEETQWRGVQRTLSVRPPERVECHSPRHGRPAPPVTYCPVEFPTRTFNIVLQSFCSEMRCSLYILTACLLAATCQVSRWHAISWDRFLRTSMNVASINRCWHGSTGR